MPIPKGKDSKIVVVGTNRGLIFPCVGVGYGAVQNSEELARKLAREKAMSESVVPNKSTQPSSNESVPPPGNSNSSADGELTVVPATKQWEDLSKKEIAENTVHNEVCVCFNSPSVVGSHRFGCWLKLRDEIIALPVPYK